MPAETPTTEPTALTAGDSWQWERVLPGFPASEGWTLSYALRGPSPLDIKADAAGDAFRVSVPPEETEKLAAGSYRWAARLTHTDGRRHTVATGRIEVAPDLARLADGRSHDERMMRLLEAALEGKLPEDAQRVEINGRAITRYTPAELHRLLGQYRAKVRQQRARGRAGRTVEVRFG